MRRLAGWALTRRQLGDFHWRDEPRRVLGQDQLEKRIELATARRKEILEADDELMSPEVKRQKLDLADEALEPVRQAGACVIAAFFSSDKDENGSRSATRCCASTRISHEPSTN